MNRPKCMSNIHRELAENRRESAAHLNTWGVYRKTGNKVNKTPSAERRTKDEAIKAAESMTRLNPGKFYIAKPLI